MPRSIASAIAVAEILIESGGRLTVPFARPEHVSIDESDTALAARLGQAWQRHWLDHGEELEVLRELTPWPIGIASIDVTIDSPRSKDRWRFPEHTRQLDMVYVQPTPHQLVGMVPALGIEASATTVDELERAMAANVKLEFIRQGRLEDARHLAALAWFEETRAATHHVDLRFHSPVELEALARGQQRNVLSDAASVLAPSLDEPVGLETELQSMTHCLSGTSRRSVLLVGPNGCGKTAVLNKYVRQRCRAKAKPIFETGAAKLIQALTTQGSWQGELAALCRELRDEAHTLYVNHLHELFEVGQYVGNALSIGDALREPLERGEIVLIAEATEEALARLEARSGGITTLFDVIRVDPGDATSRRQLVRTAIHDQARRTSLEVCDEAIDLGLRLHRRFFPYSGFPGKTIRFFETLLIEEKCRADYQPNEPLTPAAVLEAFCQQSGMPPELIDDAVALNIESVRARLRERLVGQDDAIDAVVNVVASIKTAMMREGRPLANLLFVGPTGVGKTELAKALAAYLFADAESLVRLDMSEYSDAQAVLRLTGANAGAGESLTSRIRQKPFTVVLFDEIEKAHPNFFDLLLQILGDGRLTDERGQVSSFCSAIIILTSNIGAQGFARAGIGFSPSELDARSVSAHFRQAVEDHLRPELFNRLDRVIPFAALEPQTQPEIARRAVHRIQHRPGLLEQAVPLEVAEPVYGFLGAAGYDARFGAREMKRTLHSLLTVPLARALNSAPATAQDAVRVDMGDKQLVFTRSRRDTQAQRRPPVEECDLRADNRRHIQAVREGPVVIALVNERSQLEESKRKKGRAFWDEPDPARRLRLLGDLMSRFDNAVESALALESEALQILSGVTGASEPRERDAWQTAYIALKRSLHEARFPDAQTCTVGVFGAPNRTTQLTEIYTQLAAVREYAHKDYVVGLDRERYTTHRLPLSAEHRAKALTAVGQLVEIQGPCAHLYFEGELGVHRFTSPQGGYADCYVEVRPGKVKDFVIPDDVHRQAFYEGTRPRRIVSFDRVVDRTYRTEFAGLSDARFGEHLAQRFDLVLDAALTGTGE